MVAYEVLWGLTLVNVLLWQRRRAQGAWWGAQSRGRAGGATVHSLPVHGPRLPVHGPQFTCLRSTVCQSTVHSLPVQGPQFASPWSKNCQSTKRARSFSNTAEAGRSSAKVSGELAGTVAPSSSEVRDVGGALGGMSWGRRAPGRRRPLCRNSGADAEIRGVDGGVAGCRGCEDHADVVRSRISKASRTSTMPKGAGWKTPMVPRVLMMSMMSEGTPDEMVGRDRHRF